MSIWQTIPHLDSVVLWAFVATTALSSILLGSQGFGLSRLSLPFLLGTFITGNRHRAVIWGFVIYMFGGVGFGYLYYLILAQLGTTNWWIGALLGCLHALFLLTALLPVLPHMHPRMATEYDGPSGQRRLEPPGFLGLNYGFHTPLITLVGHVVYGMILGAGYARSLEVLWHSSITLSMTLSTVS